MTEQKPLHITFIFAHVDDEHISLGLPAELALRGHEVSLIALTKSDLGSHTITSRRKIAAIRKKEFLESATRLGVQDAIILGFSDGLLHHQTKKAERRLLKELRLRPPDIVIIPPPDYHQDHTTTHDIAKWAVFHLPDSALYTRRGILRKRIAPFTTKPVAVYEMDTQGSQTWQSTSEDNGINGDNLFPVNMIVPISQTAIQKSEYAFRAYASQLGPRLDGQVGYVELAKLGVTRRGGVGLNFIPFGGYAFSTKNTLAQLFPSSL